MAMQHDYSVVTHDLFARSGGPISSEGRPPVFKVVGLVLAIASGLFIGVSFVLKKVGLLKANVKYNEEAGEGYGYLKNVWWWSGMTLMIIGEICNFAAYCFVDAILVTPLGALSVVVTTILSAIFLKERLSFVGKVGCFNCLLGSIVIAVNAPTQSAVATIQDMKHLVISPGFLSFAGVIIVGCAIVALWLGPKYGKRSMMVYLSVCSLIGGLSVVATQGLGAAITAQAAGKSQFKEWFLYVLLVFVIITLLVEIVYLNKALNLFNAALVTPTYYVFFTSSTIVTSAILFRGFKGSAASIATVVMGFLQICTGVILLQLSKSAKDVPDAAVFKGDLDQVRTVAEQEEPEYEPRADAVRGGASIIRSISSARQHREVAEAKKLHEEIMSPIGEDEQVEWDGLRRRKTIIGQEGPGIRRQKTIHPPLGMTHFPNDDDRHSDDESLHPGFFTRLRSRGRSITSHHVPLPVPLSGINTQHGPNPSADNAGASTSSREHIYGLPEGLRKEMQEDTSYRSPNSSSNIQWAGDVGGERSKSKTSLAPPPQPPPHTARRQFSFQNVFHRRKSDTPGETAQSRPRSRPGLSFTSRTSSRDHSHGNDGATEEERLGLVSGDSQSIIVVPEDRHSPPQYSDTEEDWKAGHNAEKSPSTLSGARTHSAAKNNQPQYEFDTRLERRDDYIDDDHDDTESERSRGKNSEKGNDRSRGAFL